MIAALYSIPNTRKYCALWVVRHCLPTNHYPQPCFSKYAVGGEDCHLQQKCGNTECPKLCLGRSRVRFANTYIIVIKN